jgi:hypothetical protein
MTRVNKSARHRSRTRRARGRADDEQAEDDAAARATKLITAPAGSLQACADRRTTPMIQAANVRPQVEPPANERVAMAPCRSETRHDTGENQHPD